MISTVFIKRPRLALVIAIVTTLAGLLALARIPVAQLPDIVPPQVQVTATYPGASAAVLEATVAQPIESRVIGVDKMIYMKSMARTISRSALSSGRTRTSTRSTSTTACRPRWPTCRLRSSCKG
jgi:multidrug efflux pump subunit AcrB